DAMFTLLGYQPQPWSPIDSLLVKGDMTQTLNFTDTPLVMALLKKSLGADLSSEWFPILPPNQQSPYDIGPYAKPTIGPIETMSEVTDAEAQSAAALYQRLAANPADRPRPRARGRGPSRPVLVERQLAKLQDSQLRDSGPEREDTAPRREAERARPGDQRARADDVGVVDGQPAVSGSRRAFAD